MGGLSVTHGVMRALFLIGLTLTATSVWAGEAKALPAGPYLGQKTPGLTAEAFAPGIVSTEHYDAFGVFSPDLKEFYFMRRGGDHPDYTLIRYHQEGETWRLSTIPDAIGELAMSPDGRRLYLGDAYLERTATGWSPVKALGAPFDTFPIMRVTASQQGTLFFDVREKIGTLRFARFKNGAYETPQAMPTAFNEGLWTAHPFIAPDESYLIWDSERPDGHGDTDLYVAFRQKDGSWGAPINLGPTVNSERSDAYGTVTPDGRFLFFYREMGPGNLDIYWVDAKVIERLRPD